MTAYLPEDYRQSDVLVPLGAICNALSFAIDVNPGDGTASGWFLTEKNTFELDLHRKSVLIGGKPIFELTPIDAEAHDDDIYVKASLLKSWFDADITLDMSEMTIDVATPEDLPFQERLKRLKNAQRRMKKYEYETVKIEDAEIVPYQAFSLPILYLSNSLSSQKGTSDQVTNVSTLQGNMDLLKFETSFNLAYRTNTVTGSQITNSNATLQKRDPKKSMFGPMKAGKIALGDVNYPSSPLFFGGKRGTGVLLSSDPHLGFRYAGDPDTFVLDGDAPVDWDAELYRNGNFVAFQRVGPNGRFLFENLELINGYNLFEVVLYGPEGQKTTVTREIYRGAYMLKSGETEYDFALGTPNADFIPLSETKRTDTTPGMSSQIFYGINDNLTVGTSLYAGNEMDESSQDYGTTLTASSSFLGMNVQGHALFANEGRTAHEISANIRPMGYNLSLSHTRFQNFRVEDEDVDQETSFSLYKNFGSFNLSFLAEKTRFLDKAETFLLENSVSADFLGVKFTNTLSKIFSRDTSREVFDGTLTALGDLLGYRVRGDVTYDLDVDAQRMLKDFTVSAQKDIGNRMSLRFGVDRNFISDIDSADFQITRDFDTFGLDFKTSATTDHNYTFTVGLRAALAPDEKSRYHLADPKTGGLATIGARGFIDSDNDGAFNSEKDEIIKDLDFRSSYSGRKSETDGAGVSWLRGLGESPTRITLNQASLPDIYLSPDTTFRDMIPRRGVSPILDFPFTKLGEIEGTITHNGKGVAGVSVRLVSLGENGESSVIETTATEYDGYYIFSAIKGGKYKVEASPDGFIGNAALLIAKDLMLSPAESDFVTTDLALSDEFVTAHHAVEIARDKIQPPQNPPPGEEIQEHDLKDIEPLDVEKLIGP